MIKREYKEGNYKIIEYENGTVIKQLISIGEPTEPIEIHATIEEQILAENQYQTALLEMQVLGGM